MCYTVSILSVGVQLEGKNRFLTPTEKIKTVYVMNLGMLLPWYIIEVTIEKQSETVFTAEDGEVYCRRNGLTEMMTNRGE